MKNVPNYKKIYSDMIVMKYPEKIKLCEGYLRKEKLTVLDVVKLNKLLSNGSNHMSNKFNQRFKSYDKSVIFEILDYQKKKHLTNTELAKHFELSRNTITKWKKEFL
ncbi:helix-turn-helix domain-containing protein [Chryseobacterium nematophagum]|uniref:Helix-turn-helix domain-containing protein n=1 Tax=Chryseobacterium nematophagum TaxID=2305228 RepID=A0A3M7LCB5_9FLAO|nr:helix-turn-helix domain-containing protein [Chryseobacterium nematophagum]RMZ59869.1 helix-turn-helix domain-containing protein [Chryseobacterium nematophagum]